MKESGDADAADADADAADADADAADATTTTTKIINTTTIFGQLDSKAKALALKESVAAGLAALKARTGAATTLSKLSPTSVPKPSVPSLLISSSITSSLSFCGVTTKNNNRFDTYQTALLSHATNAANAMPRQCLMPMPGLYVHL